MRHSRCLHRSGLYARMTSGSEYPSSLVFTILRGSIVELSRLTECVCSNRRTRVDDQTGMDLLDVFTVEHVVFRALEVLLKDIRQFDDAITFPFFIPKQFKMLIFTI